MDSLGINSSPSWSWPENPFVPPGAFQDENLDAGNRGSRPQQHAPMPEGMPRPEPQPTRHYPPRQCRICLETVLPTYQPAPADLPGVFSPRPSVIYTSNDPESGRLIRPCKCRGSSRYVHEGCLQAWRHADPAYGRRNYWQCPTCGFKYRLERMRWGNWISSKATQITLTIAILFLAMFILGFVADPIINLYLDPYNTISSVPISRSGVKLEDIIPDEEPSTWTEHFIKGLASLGLLSFIKVLLAMSPWQWWNLRSSGFIGGSGRGTAGSGRDRLASISWIVVLVGVGTFLWAVYKGVRAWSRRTLEKAGEKVMDVQGEDDDDLEADSSGTNGNAQEARKDQ